MADKKISALTGATTPLAGTEVLPIVQGGATVNVSVANLTAGRAPSVSGLTVSGLTASTAVALNASKELVSVTNTGTGNNVLATAPTLVGDVSLSTGNLTQGTAAKGVNFTANTPAAGMTSQLLDWYEEGTWTPNQGSGLVVVGAFSSSGTYTRVGRQITIQGALVGATSISLTSVGVMFTNAPFNVISGADKTFIGNVSNGTLSTFSGMWMDQSTTLAYAVQAQAATSKIVFTVTYFT